uniref:Uncharacterized protein n=1 Tax=Caenorhabditis japonica TaxID=281687 RepID=A0A8R1E754_CAEJA
MRAHRRCKIRLDRSAKKFDSCRRIHWPPHTNWMRLLLSSRDEGACQRMTDHFYGYFFYQFHELIFYQFYGYFFYHFHELIFYQFYGYFFYHFHELIFYQFYGYFFYQFYGYFFYQFHGFFLSVP